MVWKTIEGHFLVQRDMTPIPFIYGGVGLAGGERYDESAQYYEITSSGKVIKKYGAPMPFSIEDEMTVSNIHRVIRDTLYNFYWSQLYGYEPRTEVDVRLRGLQPYDSPLPFDADAVIRVYEQALA